MTNASSSDANKKHLRSKKLLQIFCSQRKNNIEHQPLGEGSRTDSTKCREKGARGLRRKDYILNKQVQREAWKI